MTNQERTRQWKKDNPEKVREQLRRWRARYPEKVREHSWNDMDRRFEHIREKSREYQEKHPEVKNKTAKKYRENPENKAKMKVLRRSCYLLEIGEITKTNCSCGNEDTETRMFHLDYIDPFNVIFLCKECFWRRTKERNRANKLTFRLME